MSSQAGDSMRDWWSRLFGRSAWPETAQRLARMERQLADLSRQVEQLRAGLEATAGGARPELTSLQEALLGLEKQVGRAGREQLKANSIVEAQAEQFAAALEQLRAANARREAEMDALREQSRSTQAAARLVLVQDILPALDGLDEALRSGQTLLTTAQQHSGDTQAGDQLEAAAHEETAARGWLRRLLDGPQPASAVAPQHDAALQHVAELQGAIESWVRGLTFVRQRLLDALAAEDVRPIVAAGQPFDPKYHLAIGVVPATEDYTAGTVVEELRRGYLAGERVLRHAEVIVATE